MLLTGVRGFDTYDRCVLVSGGSGGRSSMGCRSGRDGRGGNRLSVDEGWRAETNFEVLFLRLRGAEGAAANDLTAGATLSRRVLVFAPLGSDARRTVGGGRWSRLGRWIVAGDWYREALLELP